MQINAKTHVIGKRVSWIRVTLLIAIVSSFSLSEIAFAQWVLVARHAVGRIQQVTQNQSAANAPSTEVVTVILDAPAQRVYDVARNTIEQNQNVTMVNSDQQNLTLKISQGDQAATLSIRPLNNETAQLIVVGTAAPGQNPKTSQIVDGVMHLCGNLGKECKLAD